MTATLVGLATQLVGSLPSGAPADAAPPVGAVVGRSTGAGEEIVAAGLRALGADLPMTRDTVHDLASVTKVVGTTLAVMRLVSERLVSLDAAVVDWLPGFRDGGKDAVTVRDLLEHRSGMAEWWPLYVARRAQDEGDALAVVDELPLPHQPRTGYHYSDLGFIQLGRIVAAASGLALADAVRTLVHEPLGLRMTYLPEPGLPFAASAPDDRVERDMLDSGEPYRVPYRADDFTGWRTATIVGQVHDGNAHHALGGVAGHAGLFADVPDLLRLAVLLTRARELGLWRSEVVDEFFASGSGEPALGFRRYRVQRDGRETVLLGHTGFVGTAVAFDPVGELAVALGTNRLLHGRTPVPTDLLLREVLSYSDDPSRGVP